METENHYETTGPASMAGSDLRHSRELCPSLGGLRTIVNNSFNGCNLSLASDGGVVKTWARLKDGSPVNFPIHRAVYAHSNDFFLCGGYAFDMESAQRLEENENRFVGQELPPVRIHLEATEHQGAGHPVFGCGERGEHEAPAAPVPPEIPDDTPVAGLNVGQLKAIVRGVVAEVEE